MPTDAPALRPAPLDDGALARVPGVLGELARGRARDAARATPAAGATRRVASAAADGFRARLRGRAAGGAWPAVVAEVKRASPSQGAIAYLDPVATAAAYARGGAAALSVLTEPHRFGGRLAHLADVAAAVPLPALRKDFVVHPDQVVEARDAGARAVLLIVAVLGDATGAYRRFAEALGLDALVEVHDEGELDVALAAGAELIGVNNRDLTTLAIDLATAPRLIAAGRLRAPGASWIAESGYRRRAELEALRGLADAVLVGTHLAGSPDPGEALRGLAAEPVGGEA
ncbi:MAG: indole-3-glycerol phosphate synthase TrpC [Trueperaceae bacterium]|nr:indole-3-glycerol phosphate synthase TrpC [Trueperaceae bacterium]